MPAHSGVPGGGLSGTVLAELLDRFHAAVGGATNNAQSRGAGPDPISQWTAAEQDEGPPLSAAVDMLGPLPPDAVAALALGIAAELARLHTTGTIHRRLTPSNVLLPESGPRLVYSGVPHTVDGATLTDLDGSPLLIGYLTPEQILGQPIGPETDVFALGGVLAFAATGVPPFGGDEPLAVLYRIVNEEPALDAVPDAVRGLVKACLSKEPTQRPTLQTLSDRAIGVLKHVRLAQERTSLMQAADVQAAPERLTPAQLASTAIPARRRRVRPRSRNAAVLGTVVVGVAAAFLVRGVAVSNTSPPAHSAAPPASTISASSTTRSAPLPGTFLAGPGCPPTPWASSMASVAPSGGLVPNVGGGLADCGGHAIAFLKTGTTAAGASSFAWNFRLGRPARCTLSVYIAAADPSSGSAHYRLTTPASHTATVFQINQAAGKGQWVAAPALAGLSLPDGSARLVLTDAGAYAGDHFHVTASAVRAVCSPAP